MITGKDVFWANVPAMICFVGASFVAAAGHDGWGWLIFVGLLCCTSPTSLRGGDVSRETDD